MKQRLGIAQAMFHDPDMIFLDEPTDGVDPVGRREIRAIMQQLKEQGKTIFLNSHLLGEVELICDRVGILQRGEMIREGDIATLTKTKGHFQIGLLEGQTLPQADLEQRGYSVRRDGLFWEIGLVDGHTTTARCVPTRCAASTSIARRWRRSPRRASRRRPITACAWK